MPPLAPYSPLERKLLPLSPLECAVTKKARGVGALRLEWPATLMTSSPSTVVRAKISRAMLPVLILLALSAFLNFVDRANLSLAAPLLQDELGFSRAKLGILLAAFFPTYAFFQLVSGWLVDRFEVSWVIAGGFLL